MYFLKQVVARSRYSEARIAAAIERGTRQVVILGAGYDTFGLRNENSDLVVFEVDHPATQREKRARIARTWPHERENLKFVPVDFSQQDFMACLRETGFRPDEPSFFSWLGVTIYMEKRDVFGTLTKLSKLKATEAVFDYGVPLEAYPLGRHEGFHDLLAHFAAKGEPWRSWFNPLDLHARLKELGFSKIEDLSPSKIAAYCGYEPISETEPGGHFLHISKGI
jgi:methyltransferase (TIGR00027 family)